MVHRTSDWSVLFENRTFEPFQFRYFFPCAAVGRFAIVFGQ